MTYDRINELLGELQAEIDSLSEDHEDDSSDDIPLDETSVLDRIPHDYRRDDDLDVPLIMARDGVKASRDGKILQIPTYAETHQMWQDGRDKIRFAFNDEARLTDINEAVVLAGLHNLDDVYRILERWGYGVDRSL